jgi:hypothetical protein
MRTVCTAYDVASLKWLTEDTRQQVQYCLNVVIAREDKLLPHSCYQGVHTITWK